MEYDDFAVINPSDMDRVSKEYNKMIKMKQEAKNRLVFEDKALVLSYFKAIEDKLNKVKRQIKNESYKTIIEILKRNYLRLSGLLGEVNNNQVEQLSTNHNKNVIEVLVELIYLLLDKDENESIKQITKELLSIFSLLA